MSKSPFLNDDNFFKSNELTETGNLIKSEKMCGPKKKNKMESEYTVDQAIKDVQTKALGVDDVIKKLPNEKKDDFLNRLRSGIKKSSPFLEDGDDFFKTYSMEENVNLIKAKRKNVGELSKDRKRIKIAEGKWAPHKTSDLPIKVSEETRVKGDKKAKAKAELKNLKEAKEKGNLDDTGYDRIKELESHLDTSEPTNKPPMGKKEEKKESGEKIIAGKKVIGEVGYQGRKWYMLDEKPTKSVFGKQKNVYSIIDSEGKRASVNENLLEDMKKYNGEKKAGEVDSGKKEEKGTTEKQYNFKLKTKPEDAEDFQNEMSSMIRSRYEKKKFKTTNNGDQIASSEIKKIEKGIKEEAKRLGIKGYSLDDIWADSTEYYGGP